MNPDFGLDLHIEVFDLLPDGSGWAQTAGEHIYAQVKSNRKLTQYDVVVRPRRNVAKFRSKERHGEGVVRIPVVSVPVDVAEIATMEAMGSSVPVLLFWSDLESRSAHYVCINDYIAKVLVPENPNYADQETVHVRIPLANKIDAGTTDFTYFWLLSRRSKLYALFNLLNYQSNELNSVSSQNQEWAEPPADEIFEMIEVFVATALRLDVWERRGSGWWAPLEDIHKALRDIKVQLDERDSSASQQGDEELLRDALQAINMGANLGRMYEELVREWRLPTYLATLLDH